MRRLGPTRSSPWRVRSLTLRDALWLHNGTLRLGVVADTHSRPNAAGLQHLRALRPDAILHAGDIGNRAVLEQLSAIATTYAVRGNIDERPADLPDARVVDLCDREGALARLYMRHIALSGAKLRKDVVQRVTAEGASIVVCGHSHVPLVARERELVVFNPGSLGPRRFQLPTVFGVIEISRAGIEIHHVDAATGARWIP